MPLKVFNPGYSQGPSQQLQTGVVYGAGADLGATYAPNIVVTTAADTDSDALQVAGFTTFMAIMSQAGTVNTITLSWLTLDPSTLAILATTVLFTGAPALEQLVTFGAYGTTTTALAGFVFHTGKFRMRATVGNITFTNFRVWGSAR